MSDTGLLFFEVIPRETIWGGTKASSYFGYEVPDKTGQVWAFAAQPDGDTVCVRGRHAGKTLGELFQDAPEIFESRYDHFPFIISLVAPVDDLSIQVHPNDEVARSLGYEHGKNEAWLLLETELEASLVYGLTKTVDEAVLRIRSGDMEGLFRTVPTSTGEFFYIPAGTVHALGKGNVAYEVQQATDLTFRVYDYGRTDADGNPRPLDTQHALDTILASSKEINETLEFLHPLAKTKTIGRSTITEHISNDAFCITTIDVQGAISITPTAYCLCTVVKGKGSVDGETVRFVDNFILPALHKEVSLRGVFTLTITSESSLM